MTDSVAIDKTKDYIKEKFAKENTGHDYWHMHRVWKLSKHIAKTEQGVDKLTLELAALLHDIADWKFHGGSLEAGPKATRIWLEGLGVSDKVIKSVEDIIRNISFKGAHVKNDLNTIEGQIVHDADKLDAIGAIGIARAFAYGGANNRSLHDPQVTPEQHATFEAYKNADGPTINHFYEKLLLLKDRMYTKTGKRMAQHRHDFMEQYLSEFYKEWNGEV